MNSETSLEQSLSEKSSGNVFDPKQFDSVVMQTYGRFPIAISHGKGGWLWDSQGNCYLDFVAGIATCTLGHAHPNLIQAVNNQIQKLHHVSNLYYIPEQGELAQWLVQHSCADRAFFCNSGAEANEAAIKLARKYAYTVGQLDNPVILTTHDSFHGRTLATITATAQPKYQKNFEPLVPGFAYVPYNDITAIQTAIEQSQVAAILIEPLQGEGGVRPGDLDYFLQLRKLCDQHGILLIFDEVQVGVARSGHYWGYENLGVEPDILTIAKGLAGGIPIGSMLCKQFCDVFEPGDHASTFGGNPLSCGAALAVLKTLEEENLLSHVIARGEQLRKHLRAIAQQFPDTFSEVRGWGLINGLQIHPEADLKALTIVKAAMKQGLLVAPAGGNVIRLVPPLIVSPGEVEQAMAKLQSGIQSVVGESNSL